MPFPFTDKKISPISHKTSSSQIPKFGKNIQGLPITILTTFLFPKKGKIFTETIAFYSKNLCHLWQNLLQSDSEIWEKYSCFTYYYSHNFPLFSKAKHFHKFRSLLPIKKSLPSLGKPPPVRFRNLGKIFMVYLLLFSQFSSFQQSETFSHL